ncbi:hypothetical protein N7468_008114 [Penicillium chermesinum]|uniref:Uncharacterized protein n=1 Tax=Penicillium chermesinum TaxID=63820 RepID=A0A9W9NP65_9EURO|nr:uncharacterized protein N7468_008114 [Penicillium chermesinum]KAJ5223572.1 hypothetical protein N7468_008114 [Penicillium chermesinum]
MESDDARSPTDTEMGSDSESIPGSDDNSCHDTRRAPTQMEIERGLLARYPPEPDDAELPPSDDSISDEGLRDWEEGMNEKEIHKEKQNKLKQMDRSERRERNKQKREKETENRARYDKRRREQGTKTAPTQASTSQPGEASSPAHPLTCSILARPTLPPRQPPRSGRVDRFVPRQAFATSRAPLALQQRGERSQHTPSKRKKVGSPVAPAKDSGVIMLNLTEQLRQIQPPHCEQREHLC